MSNEVTMKYCPFIECGGKLQPHSVDSATGELDCDGPCSPRRVRDWRDKLKQPTKPEPKPVRYYGPPTKEQWDMLCDWLK